MRAFFTQWRILGLFTLTLACRGMMAWSQKMNQEQLDVGQQSIDAYAQEIVVVSLALISAYLLLFGTGGLAPNRYQNESPL